MYTFCMTWLANVVSLSRIPLAVLTVIFLDSKIIAGSLIVLAIFSDWLDGRLAGKGSKLGAIIDPLSDKVFIIIVGLALLAHLDWFYVILFFSRDIFTTLGAGICYFLKVTGLKARTLGKLVTVMQFLVLGIAFFDFPFLEEFIILIGVLTALSIIEYIWWFKREVTRI